MSKIIWFVSVSILTLSAAAASFNSGVSGTTAGLRLDLTHQVSLSEPTADMNLIPAAKIDDTTPVYADSKCGMTSNESNLGLCTVGSTGGRW